MFAHIRLVNGRGYRQVLFIRPLTNINRLSIFRPAMDNKDVDVENLRNHKKRNLIRVIDERRGVAHLR